jgi:fatty-acyl-CoA synthase
VSVSATSPREEAPAVLPGSHLDLPRMLRRAARWFPDAPAVTSPSVARTLAEVVERGQRLANALTTLGVPRGATVAILSENRAEFPEMDAGIVLGDRVRLALNMRLHLEDHRFAFADADVRVLLHSGRFAAEAAALAEESGALAISLDPPAEGSPSRDYEQLLASAPIGMEAASADAERPAWITYTSGTTGRPKGIVLSHRAIREVALNLLCKLDIRRGEQIVLTQPLSHGAGYFVLPYLISGAGVRVAERFDPAEATALSTRPELRTLKVVPAMLAPLFEAAEGSGLDYSSVIYGASPISRPALDEGLERFGPIFAQIYGQSEAPVTLTYLGKEDHAEDGPQRFSAGHPFPSIAIEVWDDHDRPLLPGEEGEVVICGSTLMSGYRNRPEATAEVIERGWLRTRDVGRFDERGFLYLLGRSDEMINSGGFNVAPREVEMILSEHPDVEEAAVVGMQDERWGEAIAAVVKPRRGAEPSGSEVIEFVKPRLGMRTPKRVVVVEEIGKTPYGKVDRDQLRSALENGEEPR